MKYIIRVCKCCDKDFEVYRGFEQERVTKCAYCRMHVNRDPCKER